VSKDIDGAGRRYGNTTLIVRPLLLFVVTTLVIGIVASGTQSGLYGAPFFRLFFSNTTHMKVWLATAALTLGFGQLLTAARMYGKLHFLPEGRIYPALHRWGGRIAILLTLPVAYHCLFRLGFEVEDTRAALHSTLGTAFYGALFAKVFVVRSSCYPGWVLPLMGGVLFAILIALWLTSSFWFFINRGVSL
jgi:hypothetical protein